MPENQLIPTDQTTTASSFRGLKAYSEGDSQFFFGRKNEIKELFELIRYNTLTLVFGKSGTGKTSLLNAGVFPWLRFEDCLPVHIKLVFDQGSPSLKEQVWQTLHSQKNNFSIEEIGKGESLWEFFHRGGLWKTITPVLVFDQFEEIFTLANKYPERKIEIEELINELVPLIENVVPEKVRQRNLSQINQVEYDYHNERVKVVFSFREDFLAEMESVTPRFPSVRIARFRLMPMDGNQAFEVITGTWKNNMIEPGEAAKIISYLVNDYESETLVNKHKISKNEYDLLEIEPSLLSQVCTSLDRERLKLNQKTISSGLLEKFPKENILASIYRAALKESTWGNSEIPTDPAGEKSARIRENTLRHFIEDNLVDDKGFREKLKSGEVPPEMLPAIAELENQFFIRNDRKFIELTHDVMAGIIHKDRLARLKIEERNKAIKKAIGWTLLVLIVGLFFLWKEKKVLDNLLEEKELAKAETDSLRIVSEEIRKNLPVIIPKPNGPGIDPSPNPTVDTTKWTDSISYLNQELIRIELIIRELDSLLVIKQKELDISNSDKEVQKRLTEAQRIEIVVLQNQVKESGWKIINLQNQVKDLAFDQNLFKHYGTHIQKIDSLKQIDSLKSIFPPNVLQPINALIINWEPFRRRAISQK